MSVVADKLLTAEEFAAKYDDAPFELVRGKVVPIAMPGQAKHGRACGRLYRHLADFVDARDPGGAVCTNDTFVVVGRNPDTVRGADVVYWPKSKLPGGVVPDGYIYAPPDLCAEVVSPTNTWSDILTKVDEYLAAGVPVAVVLDPDTKTATAYRKLNGHGDDGGQVFKADADLTLSDVLPGFSVPVRKFFE